MFQITVDIYEGADRTPVVTHIFRGKTMTEAEAVMRAHAKSDTFLRAALTTGKFDGMPLRYRAFRQ